MFTSGCYVVWCVEGRLAVPSKKRQGGKKRVERSRRVGGRGPECSERTPLVKKGNESVSSWLRCNLSALVVTSFVAPCCVESVWLFWRFEEGGLGGGR